MLPEGFQRMNDLGSNAQPFLFILDFDLTHPLVFTTEEADKSGILYKIHEETNIVSLPSTNRQFSFSKSPQPFDIYLRSFLKVMGHIRAGDSYLVNLTCSTKIETNLSLSEIFFRSHARYKLLVPGRFVVFSPEIFVRINNGIISSYPMKGTIDASLPDAETTLLGDKKELAEHYTIVDLIRNDLNLVARDVRVERFRYIEEIRTNVNRLLQASSQITGTLPDDYKNRLGEILYRLLPAGSVTGAPKKRTVEIIREAETYHRGYYSGIFGYFDGSNLDSGVMIRFIEETKEGKVFKSGGGITFRSKAEEEYREMIDKVYVPFT